MAPVITSLTPGTGPVGSNVLISGSGFTPGGVQPQVFFNGLLATPSSIFGTKIIVPVPIGATSGNVTVSVAGQTSNGIAFTVTGLGIPSITSVTPSFGPVGTVVTIAGNNFGTSQGSSSVRFYPGVFLLVQTVPAQVVSWSNTSIVAVVPTTGVSGGGSLRVFTSGGISNPVAFAASQPSNGGIPNPIGLLLLPVQQFNTQVVLTFDTTNFNDADIGSFYFWKVEEIIAGRTPTCSRQVILYRDLGVANITATLTGIDQNKGTPVSKSETFSIGTVSASGKICAIVRGLALTAQNLQYSVLRSAGDGPVSIVKVQLAGRVEMTAYA